jgi:hypothetical protein
MKKDREKPDDELHGANFRALRRLSNAKNETLADVGQTCERVPASSLRNLLASGGRIEPIEPAGGLTMPPASELARRRRAFESET